MTLKNTVSLLALAGSLVIVAHPALAQSAAGQTVDDTKVDQDETTGTVAKSAADRAALISGSAVKTSSGSDEIIVTGTRINRPNTKSAAPIT